MKIKAAVMGDAIEFWRWISSTTVGIVTPNAIYHWRVDDQAEPTKIFDRHDALKGPQVITYRSDRFEEWLCLVGISPKVWM